MSKLTQWMDQKLYPTYMDYWDDLVFRRKLCEVISQDSKILDYGAGIGGMRDLFDFRKYASKVCGVDIDPVVMQNPKLHEAKVLSKDGGIPYPDETFDIVFAVNVMEHVQTPMRCMDEIARVLKPGGLFMVKTPNFWHYVPIVASLTPNSFHVFVNRMRGRSAEHTFPTAYRCNTTSAVKRLAKSAGFSVKEVELIEGRPEYLRVMAPLYLLGWFYERIVNKVPGLSRLRGVLYFKLVAM